MQKIINVIVEIPKNSGNKYEYDSQKGRLRLDRVLYGSNRYPANYGFIENTLDKDGDPLDVVMLSTYPIVPNCEAEMVVLGAIDFFEINKQGQKEQDTKIFGVVHHDPRLAHLTSLDVVPHAIKDELVTFFEQYKVLENKKVSVEGWLNESQANQIIAECQQMFLNQK